MFDTIDITSQATTANILAGTLNLPFPDASPSASVEFDFPEFDYSFTAPLIDLTYPPDSRRVTARVAIDESVTMIWTLSGEPAPEGGKMLLKDAAFDFEMESGRPRAEFVADTVKALLWLAGAMRLRIPGVRFDGELNFETPLGKSNHLLRHRWTAYLLMTIERAFDREIPIPAEISDKDWLDVLFIHHAVTEKSFTWPFTRERLPLSGEEQARELLKKGDEQFHFGLEVENFSRQVVGRKLSLGQAIVSVDPALILNADEIRQRLECPDECGIQAFICSLNGVATYEFPAAPRAPDVGWNERIEEFIELEAPLGKRICDAFNELAASTLAGLTEEQIAAVTAPLEFEPFPVGAAEEER